MQTRGRDRNRGRQKHLTDRYSKERTVQMHAEALTGRARKESRTRKGRSIGNAETRSGTGKSIEQAEPGRRLTKREPEVLNRQSREED
jgi:hypothetical protein